VEGHHSSQRSPRLWSRLFRRFPGTIPFPLLPAAEVSGAFAPCVLAIFTAVGNTVLMLTVFL